MLYPAIYFSGRCLYSEFDERNVMRSIKPMAIIPISMTLIKKGLPTKSFASLVISINGGYLFVLKDNFFNTNVSNKIGKYYKLQGECVYSGD
jgi:hypothetical protein